MPQKSFLVEKSAANTEAEFLDVIGTKSYKKGFLPLCYSQSSLLTDCNPPPPPNSG